MTRRLVLWLGHFDPGFPFPMLVHLGLLALLFCLAAAFVIVGGLFDIEIGPQAAMCLAIVIVLGLVADAAADANAIARACAAARSSAGDGAMKFILGKISHAARAIDDFVDPFGFLKTILLAFILLGLLYAGFDAGLATLPEYRKFDAERRAEFAHQWPAERLAAVAREGNGEALLALHAANARCENIWGMSLECRVAMTAWSAVRAEIGSGLEARLAVAEIERVDTALAKGAVR